MTGSSFPKSTLGATTTLLVLGVALFLGALVVMTLTMNIAGMRKASGNRVGQEVQYAAESSLARANARLSQYAARVRSVSLPQGTTYDQVLASLAQVCQVSALPMPSNLQSVPATGLRLCNAPNKGNPTANQLSFFTTYTTPPAGMSVSAWQQEWIKAFSGQNNTLVDSASGSITSARGTSSTTVNGGLLLEGVSVLPDGGLRIDFSVSPLMADAAMTTTSNVTVARRKYQQDGSRLYGQTMVQPSYSLYQYLVNRRITPSGSRLNFFDFDSFEGRVHTNGRAGIDAPYFSATSSTTGPRFTGKYSTTVSALEWSSASKPVDSIVFPNYAPQYNATPVDMPTNAVKQRLAAAGIDPKNCVGSESTNSTTSANAVSSCLSSVFGSQVTTTNGVYFASGTNSSANSGSKFAGGIYVKGAVTNLKMSQVNGFQRIEITQGSTITAFTQTSATAWTVAVNGTVTKTMSSSTFNGMLYVEGNIGNSTTKGSQGLMGDGTNAGDIAPDMQMTVAAQGDIYLKQSLTYAVDPTTNPNAKNVLGIFSESGNVMLDGPNNADLNINASMMAGTTGKGFGTFGYQNNRYTTGGSQPKINLIGGIIEEQSQGVNTSGGAGYARNFKWDARFNNTQFTPPFFPTQKKFEITDDMNDRLQLSQTFRAVASQ